MLSELKEEFLIGRAAFVTVLVGRVFFFVAALETVLEGALFVPVFLFLDVELGEGVVIVPIPKDLEPLVQAGGPGEVFIPEDVFFIFEGFFQGGDSLVFEAFFQGGEILVLEAFIQGGVFDTNGLTLLLFPSIANEDMLLLPAPKVAIIPCRRLNRRVLLVSGVCSSWRMSVLFLRDFSTTFLLALLSTDLATKLVVDDLLLLTGVLAVMETSLVGVFGGDLSVSLFVLFPQILTIVKSQ